MESKKYKLIGMNGKTYLSETKGLYGGHKRLKIYGKLDCKSALRHIEKGEYIKYRVFFADEKTALVAGYRPCSVCMKEHYQLWKKGKLMNYILQVILIMDDSCICAVKLADGTEQKLFMEQIHNSQILERLRNGIEYLQVVPVRNYCAIVLQDEKYQWGYTLVWDYIQDKIVHLTNTPYAITSTIIKNKVVTMYLVQYWGHPADWWYSISSLHKIDSEYEPDIMPLKISADNYNESEDDCYINEWKGKIYFHVGNQIDCVCMD